MDAVKVPTQQGSISDTNGLLGGRIWVMKPAYRANESYRSESDEADPRRQLGEVSRETIRRKDPFRYRFIVPTSDMEG
jgi:hypothetical protein